MDIIILPKTSESCNRVYLGSRSLCVCLLFLLALGMLAVYGAYHLGIKAQFVAQQKSLAQVKSLVKDWQTALEQQQLVLDRVASQAEEGVSILARRVGGLQAEVVRLNGLGQRLVVHAGLEKGEFDFTHPPAIGGPEAPQTKEALKLSNFLITIEQLEQAIADHQQQLNLLETVLMEHDLRKAALPGGRPLHQGWMSSQYGYRTDPFNGRREFHGGIDFAGKAGTEILAVAAGIVTWVGERSGYGKLVEIDHGNGYVTRYAHNQKNLVQVGESITKGQSIALMGSTGRSTGPHVHLEVLHEGRTVDPLRFVKAVKGTSARN